MGASMHHYESQQTINILNTRVNQLDELRQQSESKAKDEADASLARSTTIINEFKTDIENKIQNISIQYQNNLDNVLTENNVLKNEVDNLKDDLSGLKNISVDIKNTQSEHNQSTLKELADLLEKIDNETAKLNELKHHVSDLDDSVTALSPDINKNADKIQELDAFKLKLEPLSTSLTQDIASLRGDGKLAEDKLKDLKDYSQKLQDAITAIQENEKHTEKDLAGVKDDSETLAEKLEDLQDKLNQLDVSSTEFKTFNSSVDEKLIVFESKLTGLENANQTNMADLINIKEQNFVQQEKVKFVEALSAKVDTMDDERKKAEALQVEINEDMISKNATAIKDLQTLYDARLDNVEKENQQQSEVDKDLASLIENLKKDNDNCNTALKEVQNVMADHQRENADLLTAGQKALEEKMVNYENQLQVTYNIMVDKQEEERVRMKNDIDALNEGIKLRANQDDLEAQLVSLKNDHESVTLNMKNALDQLTSNNTSMINIKIDECMKGVDEQRKDMDGKLEKLESDMTDIKEDINDVCEENFGKIKNDIENILKDNKENSKHLLDRNDKLQNDLQSLDNRHAETVEKLNEINVLATNIEIYVKAQEEKLEKQKEQDLSAVDSKFALLKEEITIVNKNILEVDAKGDSIGNNMKTLQDNVIARLDSQNQTDIEIRQDFESFKNSHNKSVDDIESLNTEQAEKIRALEEASMHHYESQQTINILNTRVNQLDELRQQSESKAKDEADASLARSTTIINEFKTDIENLKDDLSGLKNISVDIKNTQSEHNQSTLKELADLLEKIDNETAKLNELKHHVSDLDDSVTALSPDINKNADKIQELDAFKLKLEPLSTSITQDIASLRGDGKLAEDKLKDLKDYSQKLQDAITAIQENEKHTEKDLAGVK